MLHENQSHFYFSSEGVLYGPGDRTVPYSVCYRLCLSFPHLRVRTIYCQGCPIYPISLPDQTRNREEMASTVQTFVQAGIEIVQSAQADHISRNTTEDIMSNLLLMLRACGRWGSCG